MANITLNFINRSNDQNNSEIVIFQKNARLNTDELAVAWTVIKNCGTGDNHPFTFPDAVSIAAGDSWGNYTPQLAANPGQSFEMALTPSGDKLQMSGAAAAPGEIDLKNNLAQGAVSANIYRAGKLLATKTNIAPGQKAVFQFGPIIWIGVVSQLEEGTVMNSAIIAALNTELGLTGIASADIVMTGGGPGSASTPFRFNLENIVYA